jgi:hypothetical protein
LEYKDPEILNYRKRTLLLSVGFVVFLVVTFIVSWKYYEKRFETDVSDSRPNDFPVVINTPGRSELILLGDLEKYKERKTEYSFLVSDEKAELINKQLEADRVLRGGKGIPTITAKPLEAGKQLIEVEINGDGLWDSRYEATDKDVRPISLTVSGPGFPFFPCAATAGFGMVGFILLQGILWLSRRMRIKLN